MFARLGKADTIPFLSSIMRAPNDNKLLKDPETDIETEEKSMKTYLTIWFSSEGAEPSVVAEKLQSMGFKPVKGHYDHVYDWKQEATLEDVLQLLNNIHLTLKGLNVLYKIETI